MLSGSKEQFSVLGYSPHVLKQGEANCDPKTIPSRLLRQLFVHVCYKMGMVTCYIVSIVTLFCCDLQSLCCDFRLRASEDNQKDVRCGG
jgi:hypothetical protein